MFQTKSYLSWGRFPKVTHQTITPLYWRDENPFKEGLHAYLPRGQGLSYGDSCLNENGHLITTAALNRFMHFCPITGILRAESGLLLQDILQHIVPKKWFLPVLPGTQRVSLGGAIANDIHGKNHHHVGSFGCHVIKLLLLRSNGERLICSAQTNSALFYATIGGLGLTGLILWAELQLQPLVSSTFAVTTIPFYSLEAYCDLVQQWQQAPYSVAWIDCQAKGRQLTRGLFLHAKPIMTPLPIKKARARIVMPRPPSFLITARTMALFNAAYYYAGCYRTTQIQAYEQFFFPLDRVNAWNKWYGPQGLIQYQCVIPFGQESTLQAILKTITGSRLGSCLAVLKTFGTLSSNGLLSFPMPGITLALDFPIRTGLWSLLNTLDQQVIAAGGRVYIAKDARMSSHAFRCYYPHHQDFAQWIDPACSSNFWRRVNDKSES